MKETGCSPVEALSTTGLLSLIHFIWTKYKDVRRPKTVQSYFTALKSFMEYLVKSNHLKRYDADPGHFKVSIIFAVFYFFLSMEFSAIEIKF